MEIPTETLHSLFTAQSTQEAELELDDETRVKGLCLAFNLPQQGAVMHTIDAFSEFGKLLKSCWRANGWTSEAGPVGCGHLYYTANPYLQMLICLRTEVKSPTVAAVRPPSPEDPLQCN